MSFLQSEISWKKITKLYKNITKLSKSLAKHQFLTRSWPYFLSGIFSLYLKKSPTSFLNCFENRIKLTPLMASPSLWTLPYKENDFWWKNHNYWTISDFTPYTKHNYILTVTWYPEMTIELATFTLSAFTVNLAWLCKKEKRTPW